MTAAFALLLAGTSYSNDDMLETTSKFQLKSRMDEIEPAKRGRCEFVRFHERKIQMIGRSGK